MATTYETVLLVEQRALAVIAASEAAGFPADNMLDRQLFLPWISTGLTGQHLTICAGTPIFRAMTDESLLASTVIAIDLHPNRKWIVYVTSGGSGKVAIRSFDASTGTVGDTDIDSISVSDLSNTDEFKAARFSPDGSAIAVGRAQLSSGCTFRICAFNAETGGIGAFFSEAGTRPQFDLAAGNENMCWLPNSRGVLVLRSDDDVASLSPFNPSTGVVSNHITYSGAGSTAFSCCAPPAAVTASATNYAFVGGGGGNHAHALSFTTDSDGVPNSGSLTLSSVGTSLGASPTAVAVHPDGDLVAFAIPSSPYVKVLPWTGSAYGTAWSDPATLMTAARDEVAWGAPDGDCLLLYGGSVNAPDVYVTTTAFGDKKTAFFQTPNAYKNVGVIDPDGEWFLCADSSGNLEVYEFSEAEVTPATIDSILLLRTNLTRDATRRVKGSNGGTFAGAEVLLDSEGELTASPLSVTRTGAAASRVNSAGKIVVPIAADTLRYHYNPVTLAALGVSKEGAATNLCLQSEALGAADWIPVLASVSSNSIVAPDSGASSIADKLVEDGSTNVHFIVQDIAVTGGDADDTWTFSDYVKAEGRSQIVVYLSEDTGLTNYIAAVFTLSGAGTVVNAFDAGTGEINTDETVIEALAGASGWYRIKLCGRPAAGSSDTNFRVRIGLMSAGNESYAGDSSSGVALWGAQLELGAGATSYIRTTAAAVTRGAETLTLALTNGDYAITVEGEGATEGPTNFSGTSYTINPPTGKTYISRIHADVEGFDSGSDYFWDPTLISEAVFDDFERTWLYTFSTPQSYMFYRIEFTDAANPDNRIIVSFAMLAEALVAPKSMALRPRFSIEDESTKTKVDSGAQSFDPKPVAKSFDLVLPGIELEDAYDEWWRTVVRGTARQLFFTPNRNDPKFTYTHGMWCVPARVLDLTPESAYATLGISLVEAT